VKKESQEKQERQERQEREKREAKERQERQERERKESQERQARQELEKRESQEKQERQERQEREKREQERKAAAFVEIQEVPSRPPIQSLPPEPKKPKKEPKKEKKSKPPKNIAKAYSQTEMARSPKSMQNDDDGIPPEPISDPGYDSKGGKGSTWEQKMAEKAVGEKMEERNKIRGRRGNAANFMDTQIKNIIDRIKKNGGSITYGKLFMDTQDQMDALSAVLHTAKKRGNVEYDGVMLMQGQDDEVVIQLLKEKVEETKVFQSAMYDPKEIAEVLQTPTGPENCYICSKTVYPAERIAPNSKVMHKNCFRCHECNNLLRIDAYCLNNGKFYCKPDYERLVKSAGGSYQF